MTTGSGEAAGIRSGWEAVGWTLLVFAVALAARALALWEFSHETIFDIRMGDGRVYHLWALEIAAGDWIGNEAFYQAPLYPYFLAGVYRIAGDSLLYTRAVQVVIGSTACALLAQAGWRLFSRPVGVLAGLMLALYPVSVFADLMIQKSVLDIFLMCTLLAIIGEIDAREKPRLRSSLGLGLALGALILTRENALVFVVILAVWIAWLPGRPQRRRAGLSVLFVVGVLLVLIPVGIRNWVVSGELHLTTSQFGHNFFIGNNPTADGTYAPLVYGRGDPLVERDDAFLIVERALGRPPTPAEVSGFFSEQALEYIRSEPLDWLALLGRKLLLALNRVELVDTEDLYTYSEFSWTLWLLGWGLHFGILAPLAVFGAWVTWPERRRLWPLYALAAVYLGSLLLFYIFARYRLPLVPIALLLASAGLVKGRSFFATRSGSEIAACLACTLGVAVVANWPVLDHRYMRSVTYYNLGNELVKLHQEAIGIVYYEKAIEQYHDNALANHNLGVVMARRKAFGVARRHFEEALRIEPDYAEARFNLARVLVDVYEPEAAVEQYRKGLEIDSTQPDIHVELAQLLVEQGDRAAARRHLVRALELDPGHVEAARSLAALDAE